MLVYDTVSKQLKISYYSHNHWTDIVAVILFLEDNQDQSVRLRAFLPSSLWEFILSNPSHNYLDEQNPFIHLVWTYRRFWYISSHISWTTTSHVHREMELEI